MKTKTITTSSCTLLVVELPTGANNPEIQCSRGKYWIQYSMQGAILHKELLDVTHLFSRLNKLPDITEDQAFEIVNHYEVSHNLDLTVTYAFKDYVNGIECNDVDNCDCDYLDEYLFDNPTESLDSLLESEGIHFKNPLGEPPLPTCTSNGIDVDRYTKTVQYWQTAQEQVWDRNRMYIFKQVK